MPALSIHVGAVLHETHVIRRTFSKPAVQCQSMEGAPRRRAAPGSQWVKVAAGAATSGHRSCAQAGPPLLMPGQARALALPSRAPANSGAKKSPSAPALRQSAAPAELSRHQGVGASAHALHASATHCHATEQPSPSASEHNGHVRSKYGAVLRQAPNHSIERTCSGRLRLPAPAAHVKR